MQLAEQLNSLRVTSFRSSASGRIRSLEKRFELLLCTLRQKFFLVLFNNFFVCWINNFRSMIALSKLIFSARLNCLKLCGRAIVGKDECWKPVLSSRPEVGREGGESRKVGLVCIQPVFWLQVSPAVDAALKAGYRLFDTAKYYKNEQELGSALQVLYLPLFVRAYLVTRSVWDVWPFQVWVWELSDSRSTGIPDVWELSDPRSIGIPDVI